VGATLIVMRDPLGQDLSQMSLVERNDMVEALASRGTDQAFAKGIRLWNADRCFQLSFAKIGSGGHVECATVVKPLRHTATFPEQL
jgi:hypothetical protein